MYRQSEKNFLSSNISSTSSQYGELGPLAAEIVSLVWGTSGNFNGFRVLAALLHDALVVGVSQTAALNRGRHLYSAGRTSRWALAHISSWLCTKARGTVRFIGYNLHVAQRSSNVERKEKCRPTTMWADAQRDGRPARENR